MTNKKYSKVYKERCHRIATHKREYMAGVDDKKMIENIIKNRILNDFPSIAYDFFKVLKHAERMALESLNPEDEETFDIIEELFDTIQDIWLELGLCTFPEHEGEIIDVAERAASDIVILSIAAFSYKVE